MSSDPAFAPTRLVLVAGPSGAGKDTLIAQAALALACHAHIRFARRVVTRLADASEDHDTMDAAEFAAAAAKGAFALHWQAHGLSYAIPASQMARGGVLVCNVSRAVIAQARVLHPGTKLVIITAPPAIRAARLAARAREAGQPAEIAARLAREVAGEDTRAADLVIDNSGSVEDGGATLAQFLRGIL